MPDFGVPASERIGGLADEAVGGRLVLFVGAGVSSNCGLPDWRELVGRILDPWPDGKAEFLSGRTHAFHILDLFAKEYLGGNIALLREQIASALTVGPSQLRLSDAHRQLPRLNVNRIYTTNYDVLLEKAFPRARPYFTDDHFASLRPETGLTDIIYLHGDLPPLMVPLVMIDIPLSPSSPVPPASARTLPAPAGGSPTRCAA